MAKKLCYGNWWLGVLLFCCAIQPASAQRPPRVYLWDVASGKQMFDLSPFDAKYGTVTSVAFSPDGARLVAGSSLNGGETGYLKIWDAKKGKLISQSKLDFSVLALKFFPDGKTLVVGSHQGTRLISVKTGKPVRTLSDLYTTAVDVSRDGRMVAVSEKGRASAWDVSTAKPRLLFEIKSQGYAAFGVSISADKKYVAFGDSNAGVGLVNVATAKVVHTFPTANRAQSAAFSPDGKQLTAGNRVTGEVHVWDVAARKQTGNFRLVKEGINSLAWSPMQNVLAASVWGLNAKLLFLDPGTGKLLREIGLPDFEGARFVTFSPNGAVLAAACGPTVSP